MGDFEAEALALVESSLEYHPESTRVLTQAFERPGTVSGGQFDWGGRLLKSNGGAQRFPQYGQQSYVECKGIRELNCETYKSSRCESRS